MLTFDKKNDLGLEDLQIADYPFNHQRLSRDLSLDNLRRSMNTLPQELWDSIYDHVFTAPPGVRILQRTAFAYSKHLLLDGPVTHVSDHLHLLHVSNHSRELYARTYYAARFVTLFIGSFSRKGCRRYSYSDRLARWLESIPEAHRSLIREIIIEDDQVPEAVCSEVDSVLEYRSLCGQAWTCYLELSRRVGNEAAMKVFLWGHSCQTTNGRHKKVVSMEHLHGVWISGACLEMYWI